MEAALLVKKLRSEFAGPFELSLGIGTCAAITGSSGSGKSLFLRMIADLDPNEGDVWLNDRERATMPAPEYPNAAYSLNLARTSVRVRNGLVTCITSQLLRRCEGLSATSLSTFSW